MSAQRGREDSDDVAVAAAAAPSGACSLSLAFFGAPRSESSGAEQSRLSARDSFAFTRYGVEFATGSRRREPPQRRPRQVRALAACAGSLWRGWRVTVCPQTKSAEHRTSGSSRHDRGALNRPTPYVRPSRPKEPNAANLSHGSVPRHSVTKTLDACNFVIHNQAMLHFYPTILGDPLHEDEIVDRLSQSIETGRKPVLVVGSGILREIGFGPFSDWSILLHEVASCLRVPFNADLAKQSPTLLWEAMLAAVARRDQQAAYRGEAPALAVVAELIQRASSRIDPSCFHFPHSSATLQSIVSLNFTAVPFLSPSHEPLEAAPFPNFDTGDLRVWCPHGHHAAEGSILLSLRKYAQFNGKLESWREEYHALRGGAPRMPRSAKTLPQHHFIADVLESPLIFAGCGLKSAEWTLWWLLATKARNEAKHSTCPSIFITADEVDAVRSAALTALNCVILQVEHHTEVWARLNALIALQASLIETPCAAKR